MQKFRLINFIDRLFVSCAIFLIIYAWINFYIRNLWTTFILSIIFSSAIVFIIYYIINKKQEKKQRKKENTKEINLNFFAFQLSTIEKKLHLLKTILSLKYDCSLKSGGILYTAENKRHFMLLALDENEINNNNISIILSKINTKDIDEIDIVCENFSTSLKTNIFINIQINLIDKTKLYFDYFEKSNIYPDTKNIDNSIVKVSFVDLIKNLFVPQKSKSYFLCGLVLIFSSIILPYFIYYLIIGTILLIFSVLCKIVPLFKHK